MAEDPKDVSTDRDADSASSKPAYERPELTRHGSISKLTRSGTGSSKEGSGPAKRFP